MRSTRTQLFLFEKERCRVGAIPQTRWLRAIVKNMPQMRATIGTNSFSSIHAMTLVGIFSYRVIVHRLIKTRPSRTGVIFIGWMKQRIPTTPTQIRPSGFLMTILPRECLFSTLLSTDMKFLSGQFLSPILIIHFLIITHSNFSQASLVVTGLGDSKP